jgi:type IV secretory pathway TrbL component
MYNLGVFSHFLGTSIHAILSFFALVIAFVAALLRK